MNQISATPETTHADSIGRRACLVALAVLWYQILWGAVFWMLYYVVPEQKSILRDFEIEIPHIVASVIQMSDFVVNYYYFLAWLQFIILIAADSAAVYFLFKKPIRRMLWFLCMSALPFFVFVYGVFGICWAFKALAIQMALDPKFVQ